MKLFSLALFIALTLTACDNDNNNALLQIPDNEQQNPDPVPSPEPDPEPEPTPDPMPQPEPTPEPDPEPAPEPVPPPAPPEPPVPPMPPTPGPQPSPSPNNAPVASAGPDRSIEVGALASLTGIASQDPDGDALSYQWSLTDVPAGSGASLTTNSLSRTQLTPDVAGLYVVALVVNDGELSSAVDTVNITATAIAPPSSGDCPTPLPAVSSGTCDVTIGSGSALLIHGDIALPSGIELGAQVLVEAGSIVCTGCDCDSEPAATNATVLMCTGALVSPGLINGRISSTFSKSTPFTVSEKYEQRHDWRRGIRGHTQLTGSISDPGLVEWEELRAVIAGTTSGVTSGSAPGMMRNLDRSASSGFVRPATNIETFPLGDSNGTQRSMSCDYPDIITWMEIEDEVASVLTVAEGVDAVARNEFTCMSGMGAGGEDILRAPSAMASAAGLTLRDINATTARGTALVWMPRSDTSLYGNTAKVPMFKRAGADIALGTNWSATGSATMVRELQCASQWNSAWGGNIFDSQELIELATINPAEVAGYGDVIGSLESGKAADIAIWNTSSNDGYNAITQADADDVALVFRGGTPLYGDADLVQALAPADNCESVDICGSAKRMCAEREFGETMASIVAANPSAYPLFACGAWQGERTCTPSRTIPDAYTGLPSAPDADGDGVPEATDNCPGVFNPPTPLDPGNQADSDGDGIGDMCDPVDNG